MPPPFACRVMFFLAAGLAMAAITPKAAQAKSASPKPFRDCAIVCPEMIAIPAGSFHMGAEAGEEGRPEGPVHEVHIARAFALGRREVSNAEYAAFIAQTGYVSSTACRSYDRASGKVDPIAGNEHQQGGHQHLPALQAIPEEAHQQHGGRLSQGGDAGS